MISEKQYLDAIATVREYAAQIEASLKEATKAIEAMPFLEQVNAILSLKSGDKIEVLTESKRHPSLKKGDVLTVGIIEVVARPVEASGCADMGTCDVVIPVRKRFGNTIRISASIMRYSGISDGKEYNHISTRPEFKIL